MLAAVDVLVACVDADVYVDVAKGSDSNVGSMSEPWQTLTHAIAATGALTIINVNAGTLPLPWVTLQICIRGDDGADATV